MVSTRRWHTVSSSTGYYQTDFSYDERGRTRKVVSPDGSATLTDEYDIMDRALHVKVGLASESESVFQTVVEYTFDDPDSDGTAEQGVGNGNLSWTIEDAGESYGSVGAERKTFREYDWRGRLVMARP